MDKLSTHWTEENTDDFLFQVSSGFTRFLERAMGESVTQGDLAQKLNVTKGRVSQVLNNPGNLTLKKMIEYSRALRLKVAIVGYDDGDIQNHYGPIPSEIFEKCWMRCGKPRDQFEFEARAQNFRTYVTSGYTLFPDFSASFSKNTAVTPQGFVTGTGTGNG